MSSRDARFGFGAGINDAKAFLLQIRDNDLSASLAKRVETCGGDAERLHGLLMTVQAKLEALHADSRAKALADAYDAGCRACEKYLDAWHKGRTHDQSIARATDGLSPGSLDLVAAKWAIDRLDHSTTPAW